MHGSSVETRTHQFLDESMNPGIVAGPVPETMVYDDQGRPRRVTQAHFGRLRRKLKIFRWLERLEFDSFIDIASGWDHVPRLVHARYGVPSYYSDMVHRMNLPLDGPEFGKLDHAVTIKLPRLPFADGAFDVVLCSEVFEHLVRPVEAMAELLRVARKYVILTSLEALSLGRWQRFWAHHRVDVRVPHIERNFLLLSEFEALLGADIHHENLLYNPHTPASPFAAPAERQAAYARLADQAALEAALCHAVAEGRHGDGAMGILLVKVQPGARVRAAGPDDDRAIARWLIEQAAWEERYKYLVVNLGVTYLRNIAPFPQDVADALRTRPVAPALRGLLRCPDCRGELDADGRGLRCRVCGHAFASDLGVPILYPQDAPDEEAFAAESLRRLCGADPGRRRIVRRLIRRLRRNESPPSLFRRTAWWIDRHLGTAARVGSPTADA